MAMIGWQLFVLIFVPLVITHVSGLPFAAWLAGRRTSTSTLPTPSTPTPSTHPTAKPNPKVGVLVIGDMQLDGDINLDANPSQQLSMLFAEPRLVELENTDKVKLEINITKPDHNANTSLSDIVPHHITVTASTTVTTNTTMVTTNATTTLTANTKVATNTTVTTNPALFDAKTPYSVDTSQHDANTHPSTTSTQLTSTLRSPVLNNPSTKAPEVTPTERSRNPNDIPVAQKLTAEVFSLYEKWHGVVVEPELRTNITVPKVTCDVFIEYVRVTDNSKLSGRGKFYGQDFTFNGTVKPDGSLNLTFSRSVASKLSNCTFKNVDGHIYFDGDRDIWVYKGNVTETDSDERFLLEPVDDSARTTRSLTRTLRTPRGRNEFLVKDDKSAMVALGACGGILFLLLFGFLLAKLIG